MIRICALAALLAVGTPGYSAIISVAGPNSSGPGSGGGVAPEIIAAPIDVLDDTVRNNGQQGFDEAQGILTNMDYETDGGVISSGTLVDSHMIFLNSDGRSRIIHNAVLWSFSGRILGIMSDSRGLFEVASTPELGAPTTNYTTGPGAPSFRARGLERNDSYQIIAPNQLLVSLRVTEPGDWLRVVTEADLSLPGPQEVPEPGAMVLIGSGMVALAILRRRRPDRQR